MVDRVSQAVNFKAGNQVQATQSGTGFVAPDSDKFRESSSFTGPSAGSQSAERVLQRILQVGEQLAGKAIQQEMEESYLSGVAKAGTIESEAELEANPLMRAWVTSGYRDTMGRLAAADNEAKIAKDMVRMREKSPAEFADYMAERRKEVTGQWEGMTLQARQTMFAQRVMQERASIMKHSVEHTKFGIEMEEKSIKAQMGTQFAALDGAKTDQKVYGAALDSTYATLYSSVFANQKLPPDVRSKLLAEVATFALENDHQGLYTMINERTSKHQDGSTGSMGDAMSWDDKTALSKAYGASLQRTEAFRAHDYMARSAKVEADWENPNTELMPFKAVEAHINEGIQRKFVSADQSKSIWAKWYQASEKKQAASGLAARYAAGDIQGMMQMGKTTDEGLTAYVDVLGRKMSLPQITDNLMTIGLQTGQGNAYRKVGQLLAPAFAQLGGAESMDPANAASVTQTLKRIDAADKTHAGAFHSFLSAFDPEVQAKISYLRDNLQKGMQPTAAIASAEARVLDDAKSTPAQRAAIAATKAAEINTAVSEVEPLSIWSSLKTGAAMLVGDEEAKAKWKLSTRRKWFEDQGRVDQVMWPVKRAVQEHMTEIATNNPHLSIGAVKTMAFSAVANRTVETEWGPLLVPKGMTPQRFFGVSEDVGAERISSALAEFIKPAKDNRIAFSLGTSGQLMYQELNAEGKPASAARIINPAVVGPMVQTQRARQTEEFKLNHGPGVVKQAGAVKVQYNGDNSAYVDNGWMRKFRDDLVQHEGVRDSVYDDGQGNLTAGVGILIQKAGSKVRLNAIQPDAKGKVTEAQINESFMRESDRAAAAANRAMANTGLKNESAFRLYGSLAYQSGTGFASLTPYQPMLKALASKNPAAAEAALRNTPAFKLSQPERQQYYLKTLLAAMKG